MELLETDKVIFMKRGKLEQIIDLFEACRKDANITTVMKSCRLNLFDFRLLLNMLQEEGYLGCYPAKPKTSPGKRKYRVYKRMRYQLTEKGICVLKASAPFLELKQKLYPPRRVLSAITVK